MTEIFLNTEVFDRTSIREYLVFNLYNQMGIDMQKCYLGHMKINKEDHGPITIVEVINKKYAKKKYDTEEFNLYKPTLPVKEADFLGADLHYYGEDESLYASIFNEIKTDETTNEEDKIRLINVLNKISSTTSSDVIESCFVDFDKIIKIVAINKVVANIDTFTSQTVQNYYLYEKDGKIDILPYDFDLSLGVIPNPLWWHENINDYNLETCSPKIYSRITEIILENEEYLSKYNKYVEEALVKFKSEDTIELIDKLDRSTDKLVQENEDPFYSYKTHKLEIEILKDFVRDREEPKKR